MMHSDHRSVMYTCQLQMLFSTLRFVLCLKSDLNRPSELSFL